MGSTVAYMEQNEMAVDNRKWLDNVRAKDSCILNGITAREDNLWHRITHYIVFVSSTVENVSK